MKGTEFEEYLGELFRKMGYSTSVTKKSGDYGADVVIRKNGKIAVIQAKRYKKDVGLKAVQEVLGAMAMYKADEGWVITNRGFTKPARQLAFANKIKLVDRDGLISLIIEAKMAPLVSANWLIRGIT